MKGGRGGQKSRKFCRRLMYMPPKYMLSPSHLIGGHEPAHLSGAGELPVDEALDLAPRPPVVDVDHGEHEPLARLELVLHAVLEAFPLHLEDVERNELLNESTYQLRNLP